MLCLLSTSVRATLRMRAIYKNQFLPWQRNAHKRKTVGEGEGEGERGRNSSRKAVATTQRREANKQTRNKQRKK